MTEFAWNKEPRLGIKASRVAVRGLSLSGVIHVVEAGRGFAYIDFMPIVVERIGKHMPYGIGPENPAFLKVVRKPDIYEVWCEYLDKSRAVLLWQSPTMPKWVRRIRYANAPEKTSERGSAGYEGEKPGDLVRGDSHAIA